MSFQICLGFELLETWSIPGGEWSDFMFVCFLLDFYILKQIQNSKIHLNYIVNSRK